MNIFHLLEAEKHLREAHFATIKQSDRDKIKQIHADIATLLRAYGVFIAEIKPD